MGKNKHKKAYIVTSLQSHSAVKKIATPDDVVLVVPNENYCEIKNLGEEFYLRNQPQSSLGDDTIRFISSWYKDAYRQDQSLTVSGFSLGALMSCNISVQVPLLIREALAMDFWKEEIEEFIFPANYGFRTYLEILRQHAGYPIKFYEFNVVDAPVTLNYSFRRYDSIKYVHPLKRLLSLLLSPFRSFIVKDKNLYMADWTYGPIVAEDPDGVVINGSKIRKSVYNSVGKLGHNLPTQLDESGKLKETMRVWLVKCRLSEAWTESLWHLASDAYQKNLLLYESVYSFYEGLLKLNPKSITLPTDMVEEFNIAAQIGRLYGIKTFQLIDGFPILASYPILTTNSGDYFFSNIYAQSLVFKEQFVKHRSYAPEDVKIVVPYSERILRGIVKESPAEIDALIFTLIPNNLNPDFRFSHLSLYLGEACGVLYKLGCKKIVIKCKSRTEEHYVAPVAAKWGVEYSFDPSLQVMPKASLIVGGISSAAMEAHLLEIPYYIFEPVENGYTDKQLHESSFGLFDRTARTPIELERNILAKKYFESESPPL